MNSRKQMNISAVQQLVFFVKNFLFAEERQGTNHE